MSLRVAVGAHPLLGEGDAHLRTLCQALAAVGASPMPLISPNQWPGSAPDVVHYAGPFHVRAAMDLVARAQHVGLPFFLSCRFPAADQDHSRDLWQRARTAAIAASTVLFAPGSTASAARAELRRPDVVSLPEVPDLPVLDAADVDGFRRRFGVAEPYLLLLADRVEEEQQQHLLLQAARLTGMRAVVLGRSGTEEYRARCDRAAAPGTVFAGYPADPLTGGAVRGAAASLIAPRHGDHAIHVLTAVSAGSPVVAGPGTARIARARCRLVTEDPAFPARFAEAIARCLARPGIDRAGGEPDGSLEELGCALLRGYGAIPVSAPIA